MKATFNYAANVMNNGINIDDYILAGGMSTQEGLVLNAQPEDRNGKKAGLSEDLRSAKKEDCRAHSALDCKEQDCIHSIVSKSKNMTNRFRLTPDSDQTIPLGIVAHEICTGFPESPHTLQP